MEHLLNQVVETHQAILPLIAAAIPAVASAVSAIGSSISGKASRDYNTQMYVQQRKDNLADWNMQNEYNTPSAQMARLKAAGLNPNLVYGNGGVTQPSVAIRSASTGGYHAPNVGDAAISGAQSGINSLAAYQSMELTKQQINNLQTQNTVATQDALLKEAQRYNVNADTGVKLTMPDINRLNAQTMAFDLGMKQDLKAGSLTAQQLELQSAAQKIDIDSQANVRAWLNTGMGIQEAAQRIAESKQRVLNEQQQNRIRQFDEKLQAQGFTRNDPYYIRAAMTALKNLDLSGTSNNPEDFWKKGRQLNPKTDDMRSGEYKSPEYFGDPSSKY